MSFVSLNLENFKHAGTRAVKFDRVSVVRGGLGGARAQVFDAMGLLRDIAEGRGADAAPAAWFGTEWPTVIAASFRTERHGELTYSATLQRIDERRVRVVGERLACGEEQLLVRTRYAYSLGRTKGRYGIGAQEFALHKAASVVPTDDPIAELTAELRSLWMVNPNPSAMKGVVGTAPLRDGDASFSNLVTCIVMQLTRPAVARAMMEMVRRVNPDLRRCAVERNANGAPYLAVYRNSDLDARGTSFGQLENGEKMLFLAAFVCAMNAQVAPMPVVWDSPLNWLGGRERATVANLLRQSFAHRGQLVMLA